MKPGAYLIAFGGARTFHRLACAIEDAGFNLIDTLVWLYGSGMPKSRELSRDLVRCRAAPGAERWSGYGTSLKPAFEPILLCRRPGERTYAQNALTWGCGALNIGAARIPHAQGEADRFPSNVFLDFDAAQQLDAQAGLRRSGAMKAGTPRPKSGFVYSAASGSSTQVDIKASEGGPSRFFYVSKARTRERQAGMEGVRNDHPTLKPVALTERLATLILPPEREDAPRRLLVPFSGAGSEILGALRAGFEHVSAIEGDAHYRDIALKRCRHAGATVTTG